MTVERGQPVGQCACGCGAQLYERIYRYSGRGAIVRRPTRLPGHGSRPPNNWPGRRDMVPAKLIWKLLRGFKRQYQLTWPEISKLVGCNYDIDGDFKRRYIARTRAERILRSLLQYHQAHRPGADGNPKRRALR